MTFEEWVERNKGEEVELCNGTITVDPDGNVWVEVADAEDKWLKVKIDADTPEDKQGIVEQIFEDAEKEIRFCTECGAPMDDGWTDGCEDYFCSEECLKANYDKYFGEGNWYGTGDEGENGGFFRGKDRNGEYYDTGLYWTDWY